MKQYKVELCAKLVSFKTMTVEADSPEEAKTLAIADAHDLSAHDWDLEEVTDIEVNDPNVKEVVA